MHERVAARAQSALGQTNSGDPSLMADPPRSISATLRLRVQEPGKRTWIVVAQLLCRHNSYIRTASPSLLPCARIPRLSLTSGDSGIAALDLRLATQGVVSGLQPARMIWRRSARPRSWRDARRRREQRAFQSPGRAHPVTRSRAHRRAGRRLPHQLRPGSSTDSGLSYGTRTGDQALSTRSLRPPSFPL